MTTLADYSYALADGDYYAPPQHLADSGRRFRPSTVPAEWSATQFDLWTLWTAAGTVCPDQGWKIHVSARLDRADAVLDEVAKACVAERVSFKHLRSEMFFLLLHHKHAARSQAGKFCAAYPPDEPTARRLLDRLANALADEAGPYILSDRRYRDSRTVHYRFGAFRGRGRQRPDGTQEWLVRDGYGRDCVDRRAASFTLPEGIADPFVVEVAAPHRGSVVLHHYEVTRAIQPSNAGGTYEGRDLRTGRKVFVKEARAHNGLYWDGSTAQERLRRESRVLAALHAAAPGVCPEPLDYFREWEHEFLVTEFVEGVPLNRWTALHAPVLFANRSAEHYGAYHADCARILAAVDQALDQIHGLGYRFGDVNPRNILVRPDSGARLVDFEAASHRDEPAVRMGADGYVPPADLPLTGPFGRDAYGMAAVALGLLMPLHNVVAHSPANLLLLRRDLERQAPVPDWLWQRATRFSRTDERPWPSRLPTARQLDAQPRACLEQLAVDVRRALLAQADPANPERLFPSSPRGLTTNTTCVAHGAAGVVHALHLTGADIPDDVLARFRRDATDARAQLPPGLHFGSAGVGWVLAELGLLDEAADVMDMADAHPVAARSATLGGGLAGIGLAHLRLCQQTGDQRELDSAVRAGDTILASADLTSALDDNDAVGLLHGRAGVALFLFYLARDTGQQRYLRAGRRLLHADLDRGIDLPDGTLSFPDDAVTRRAMPYLYAGSAGIALVATRYLATAPDEKLAAAMPRVLGDVTKTCTVQPGLYCGLAGLAFALAEHADWAGDASHQDAAVHVATCLAKYALPHESGMRFLGDGSMRFSAELWSGGAGVLLGLHRVLRGPADQFLTLDVPSSSPRPSALETVASPPELRPPGRTPPNHGEGR